MNALQQMASQLQLGADYLRRIAPAFPKPHLFKAGGVWHCTRHVYQDEFMTMPGVNPRQAWIACNLPFTWSSEEMARVMGDMPLWCRDAAYVSREHSQ